MTPEQSPIWPVGACWRCKGKDAEAQQKAYGKLCATTEKAAMGQKNLLKNLTETRKSEIAMLIRRSLKLKEWLRNSMHLMEKCFQKDKGWTRMKKNWGW